MSRNVLEQRFTKSFVAGGTIPFGKPVMISSGAIIVATTDQMIGVADYDDARAVVNDAEQYVAGDMVSVILDGPVETLEAGGTFAEGDYVKNATAGKMVVETTPTTKTLLTKGIALEAGAAASFVEIMRCN